MDTLHSAEPWTVRESSLSVEIRGKSYPIAEIQLRDSAGPILDPITDRANAARIVACVHACAGIADPVEVMHEIRAAMRKALARLPADDYGEPAKEAIRAVLAKIGEY